MRIHSPDDILCMHASVGTWCEMNFCLVQSEVEGEKFWGW